MLFFSVTLHNLPEGMAVGVVYAALIDGADGVFLASALTLSLGIALQNLPEGAVISMPMVGSGASRAGSFWAGVLSGVVEPLGGVLMLLLSAYLSPVLPYLLSFAAGAMLHVVVRELVPASQTGRGYLLGVLGVSLGFSLMMVLDVAFG
jgi:ZIP family zinc transporter